jgi:hypothetical protein
MKYYTFLPQFHEAILNGTKISTMRQKPKVKVGEKFALRYWTGKPYRSKQGTLGVAVCTGVYEVLIDLDPSGNPVVANMAADNAGDMFLHAESIATVEGFASAADMVEHFQKHRGLPFKGWATTWQCVEICEEVPE